MEAFAQALVQAEGLLREYHATTQAQFKSSHPDEMIAIRENSRLIFTLSWTKAVLFSRAIIDQVNAGNLLAAFQSLRAYAELVATVRFTAKEMMPLIQDAAETGSISVENARTLSSKLNTLLHGGRFNWPLYFEEGAKAVLDRKRAKTTKEERRKFETNSLRVGTCFEKWAEEEPAVEFIYDYLCDLVHPNKGSNLILLVERGGNVVFDTSPSSQMGWVIFGRIFPFAASMCLRAMGEFQPIFALLGAEDEARSVH
ncbi:hypothetical protein H9L15_01260 [Sphingomonas daechungensis]|uniref:HEPN AbiU2-like domain-containing protein n=2 Tax=Sphingomonas daechungensis TaxID=1176646 RepID=A0ABX6T388_9SPHN|nr:hypothetical protein H9L15_01260 [Sphingomonas daechungensis]